MQVMGGASYFTDRPQERWMRDARINTIGEGANEVLKAFIAVVGSRAPGVQLDAARRSPFKHRSKLIKVGWEQTGGRWSRPDVPVQSGELRGEARALAGNGKRLGDVAIDLYAAACTLARLDHLLTASNGDARPSAAEVTAGKYFLRLADRRIAKNFEALKDNDDPLTTAAADAALGAG